MLWHPSVRTVVISKLLQMVTCEVIWPESQKLMIILVIYDSNCAEARKDPWVELVNLSSSQAVCGKPWIALGDFNQTFHPNEYSRTVSLNVDKRTREFRECLMDADLSDLNFKGNTFTWLNKRKSRPVAKKIDRVPVNDQWYYEFLLAIAKLFWKS